MFSISPRLQERLLFIPLITGIFALLSFGFMTLVGGGTRRIKILGLCSTIFVLGTGYCMSWHKELTAVFGWKNAWIAASGLVALGAGWLYRWLLLRN